MDPSQHSRGDSVKLRHVRWLPTIIGVAGLLATAVLWQGLRSLDRAQFRTQFERASAARQTAIERELMTDLEAVQLSRPFFGASLSKRHFDRFAEQLLDNHAAIEALYWAEAREAAGEVRDASQLEFTLPLQWGLRQDDEPWDRGYDLAENLPLNPVLLSLAQRVEPLLTSGRLPWQREDDRAKLFLVPVRRKLAVAGAEGSSTIPAPPAAEPPAADPPAAEPPPVEVPTELSGVLIAAVHVDAIVDRAVRFVRAADYDSPRGIDVEVYEMAGHDRQLVYAYRSPERSGPQPVRQWDFPGEIASSGVYWELHCMPTDDYLASFRSPWPWLALLLGAAASITLMRYSSDVINRQQEVESQVARRTRQLRAVNEALRQEMAGRLETELALNDAMAAYRDLMESLPLNVFRKDLEGRIVSANPRFCETIGRDMDEVLGKTDRELFDSRQADKYQADDRRVIATGEVLETIEEHVQADGRRIFVQVLKAPARDAEGQIVGVQGLFWDVTARKLAEEARHASDARARRLVDANLIGVAIARDDGEIFEANEAFLQAIGREPADLGHLNWNQLTPEEHRRQDAENIDRVRRGERCLPWEKELQHRDGRRVPVVAGVAWMPGPPDDLIWFALDITARKRIETQLQQATEDAVQANQAKSRFLANMSHEVRTPLNGVINLTELVLQTPLTPRQREYLGMVKEAGEALLGIINDVLDFSKTEAGKLSLSSSPFDIRELVGDSLKSLAMRAAENDVEVIYDIDADVPQQVVGDPLRVRQVLVNLAGNAIKFTHGGEVEVRIERVEREGVEAGAGPPAEAPTVELAFHVRDTGIGIPPEKLDDIFEAFEQADDSTTREYGGAGLGLSIVRSLVELMGGEIRARSAPGQGSEFRFNVPFQEQPSASPPPPLPAARVLLAAVNDRARETQAALLRSWGLEVEAVGPRDTERAGAAGPFDVVIADATIDADAWGKAPRILLSSKPQSFESDESDNSSDSSPQHATGEASANPRPTVAARLLKPVKHSELRGAVESLLAPDRVARAPLAEPAGRSLPRLRILAAEDSRINITLIQGLLEDHDLTIAHNGKQAVEKAAAETFDVILMDVRMPVMDGLEATRRIRSLQPDVPIVAMTAQALEDDRRDCLAAGMTEYLTKPVQPTRLFETLRRVCLGAEARDVEGGDSAAHRPQAAAGDENPEPEASFAKPRVEQASDAGDATSPSDVGDAVDWDAALELVEGRSTLLGELVEMFLTEGPRLLAEAEEAARQGDAQQLTIAAHTLKGSLRYFGPTKSGQLAARLEQAARDSQLQAAPEMLAELRRRMDSLMSCLLDYGRARELPS